MQTYSKLWPLLFLNPIKFLVFFFQYNYEFHFYISERNSNVSVRIGENLTIGPESNPSHNSSSPPTHASATRSSGDSATDPTPGENLPTSIDDEEGIGSGDADMPNVSDTGGDSATDPPSSENPPTEGLGITRADTDTPSITIARGDSTVSPINTDSPSVKEPRDSRNIRSGTGDSSEEESPIRNIRG